MTQSGRKRDASYLAALWKDVPCTYFHTSLRDLILNSFYFLNVTLEKATWPH